MRRTVNRLADDSKKWEDERAKLAADNKKLKEDFAGRDEEQADRILALENTRSHGTPPANGGMTPPFDGTGDFFGGGPITAALVGSENPMLLALIRRLKEVKTRVEGESKAAARAELIVHGKYKRAKEQSLPLVDQLVKKSSLPLTARFCC